MPQVEAKNLANDDDKPLITTGPVVIKCPDTTANYVSSTTAHVHTSVTRDHSITEPCNECSNFNIIHKNESLEPTHNSTSESTGLSTDVSRWEETALNASNRKSDKVGIG